MTAAEIRARWERRLKGGWQEGGEQGFPVVRNALLSIDQAFDWYPAILATITAHRNNFGGQYWTKWSNVPSIINEIARRAGKPQPIASSTVASVGQQLNAQHAEENKPSGLKAALNLGNLGKTALTFFTKGPQAAALSFAASTLTRSSSGSVPTFNLQPQGSAMPEDFDIFDTGSTSSSGWDVARDLLRIAVNSQQPQTGNPYPVSALIPDYGPTQVAALGLPALGGMLGGAARLGGAALGAVRSVGGKILRWVLPSGRVVSRKQAVQLAKEVGIVAAASAIGATADEIAQAVLDEQTKQRRGRGITAAQLRTTTRTIGKLERAHRVVAKAARAHVGRR